MSEKLLELKEKIEKLSIPAMLLMASQLYDKQPEIAEAIADRAVLRMQSKKIFGRDLLER